MYCINCGRKIPDDAKFCDKCGKMVLQLKQEDDIIVGSERNVKVQSFSKTKKSESVESLIELEEYPEKDDRILIWRLFSTKGIVKRKEYVLTILTCELLATVLGELWGGMGISPIIKGELNAGFVLIVLLLWILVWFKIAVTVKRLKSCGWNKAAKFVWVLCFYIVTDLMLMCILSLKKSKYK